MDKSLPGASMWSNKRVSPSMNVTSKEEGKEEPGRAGRELRGGRGRRGGATETKGKGGRPQGQGVLRRGCSRWSEH